MTKTHKYLTIAAMVASLGLLGACSSDDTSDTGSASADQSISDKMGNAAHNAGEAVREGADKADKTIQDNLGDGSPSTDTPPPENQG
ncbi:hypothetical protein ERD78_08345 [Allopusillimonas soli]|uniref:Entericidin n=1 Tax=Allopusillimonas soli TaxID=659016 RepID=A0A853FDF3_9BURK|nr:hypothetical protein [Allopusillimonas soli]NYT36880.1 hypothetical protein [Allopusillimonas soli]TEA75338.1 hypothetical protein ERD78_08345 [Allopusillimonas soli]